MGSIIFRYYSVCVKKAAIALPIIRQLQSPAYQPI